MRRHTYIVPVVVVCAIVGFVIARNTGSKISHHFETAIMMDTVVEVSLWSDREAVALAASDSALKTIAHIENIFGDGVIDPEVDHEATASPEYRSIMDVARSVYTQTGGLFDPTIGSVTSLWHYWEGSTPPPADTIAAALGPVGLARYLEDGAEPGLLLDMGGIAKGYAVDAAVDRVVALGIRSAIINAGGDLRLVGKRPDGKPWRIAIRHPRQAEGFIGYIDVEDAAVATSGDYERCFVFEGRRYHHILDPHTGFPGSTCASVTVVASNACTADGYATGLFLLGPGRGLALVEATDDLEAVLVWADGESVAVSSGLEDRFGRFDSE